MSQQRHIVFLTPGFPTDEAETSCIPFLQRFVFGFTKLYPQYRFTVISFQYPFVKKTYEWHGVEVHALNGRNRKYFYKLLTWKKVFSTFKKIYRPEEETVIHSFWLSDCALIGQMIAKKHKLHHVSMMMGQDCYPKNKYLKILKLRQFDVVSGSDFTANHLNAVRKDVEVKRIIKGIDEWNFSDGVEGIEREIDIIGVGNLSKLKNYLRFVKIIHEIKQKKYNISALIIGSKSNQYEEVVDYIEKNNLHKNVQLVPFSTREKVLEYMRQSKVLLHTSNTDEQPFVILEALASGAHAISTPVGQLPYPDRVTYLDDDQQIIEKLNVLLTSDLEHDRYIPFTLSDTIKRYHDLYFRNEQDQ